MHKIILLVLLTVFSQSIWAQRSKRHQKESQEKELKAKQLVDEVFGEDDPDFEVRDIPDKWQNESAVIIAQKLLKDYRRRNRKNIYQTEISRRMILLQDKSSVEEFSEFYYLKSDGVGIRIIKPDGREIEVDRSEAIEVEKSGSKFGRSYSGGTYYKVAIPNLEVGDILDYFYAVDKEIELYYTKIFDPVYIFLQDDYPIIKQVIDLTIDKSFYVNAKTLNNAPKLERVKRDNSTEKRTRYDNAEVYSYVLIDTMREKAPDLRWFYRARELPFIKFQVMYFQTGSTANASPLLKGVGGIPKDKFSISEINDLVDKLFNAFSTEYYTSETEKNIKRYHRKDSSQKQFERAYYYLRYLVYIRKFIYNDDWTNIDWPDYNSFNFASDFKRIVDQLKGDDYYERCYFSPRYDGVIEDIMLVPDIRNTLLIKMGVDKAFLIDFDPYTNFGDVYYYMEGIPILSTNHNSLKRAYKIPVSTADDNKTISTMNVKVNDDLSGLKIKIGKTLTGQNRMYDWGEVITPLEMINEDKNYLQFEMPEDQTKNNVKKKQILDERNRNMEEFLKNQSEKRKKSLESEYDITVDEYLGLELEQSGRYHNKPDLIFNESFTTNDFIQKAGRNYILNAGMLIGSQVEIGDDEKEREYDIYMSNARSFENNIVIEIPAGHTVSGIEKLNMHVSNETGSFVSTAKMNGNNLEIQTKKTYKHNFEKAEDWPLMIEFLDAAYKFTQIKVVLKKSE
jgi:Domain of Unknown Function with PDB structure (DUF3857)